ncbi:RNA-binding protein YlmH [Anaeroplasma bactoclasticum]|jgi:RNA-binding protein YlmH|uniref:RNA-binding protein YlmH n=1 Tax=Anaeroplasma bactoclasticum TaxID=2088 RepID=A0A397RYL6_9MOLU|nr:YlmH/Sll1252 family protein [Anaeroplasma bactoclasticum]RIA78372.1 RNA-binding protein YlmH [Anaeroplasma bactoclasticum]
MEGLESFKRRIESSIKRVIEGGVVLLPFLDDAEEGIVLSLTKYENNINVYFDGGIINSDRKRCIITTYDIEKEDFKIRVFEIIYNKKYYELYHRSILGALMGLGIKRECVGDIVITLDKRCYVAVTEEISSFLLAEFKSVGKAPIELKEVDYPIENEIRYQDKVYFLSSLRLDVVIANAYSLSRSEALEYLERGDVSINHFPNQNPSHICKLDDEISVRHKGRVKVSSIGGTSKSGRLAITLSKRV